MTTNEQYDLIVVGGGPAGLQAALLGVRARLRVLLLDGGERRNLVAAEVHGFLTQDGTEPAAFREFAMKQLYAYESFAFKRVLIDDVVTSENKVRVLTADNEFEAPAIVLAVGMVDILPNIKGLLQYWGKGVYHCPYCDGYEHKDQRWGLLYELPLHVELACFLLNWTPHLTVFTNGSFLSEEGKQKLDFLNIPVETGHVRELSGGETLSCLTLADNRSFELQTLLIRPHQTQVPLIHKLKLELQPDGGVQRDENGQTSTRRVYAVGDLKGPGHQQVVTAVGDSARVLYELIKQVSLEKRGVR